MPRFSALARARAVVLQSAAGDKDEVSYDRQVAWPYRQGVLAPGDAEMAERVVSHMSVAECVLRCGGLSRGCGIPIDDPCLLAMQGASQTVAYGSRP
jgi:hypothetical protein